MSITRKQAKLIATSMVNNPTKEYQLHKNGDFGVVNNEGGFKAIYRYAPSKAEGSGEVVWQQSVERLVEQEPKLKFKTYLEEYLYRVLTPKIKEIKSRGLTGNKKIDDILKSGKYNKYLQNDRIEIDTYINNEEQIKISSDTTGFANHTKIPFYTKDELLALHQEVRELAVNEPVAKIHRPYKKKKFIEENYELYEEAYRSYLKDYTSLGQLWEWKLSNDGIHQGYGQDDVYKEVILPIEFRLQGLKYNNRVIREINKIVRELNRMKKDLEDLKNSREASEENEFTFVLTNEDEVDYSKPYNGNNGNYEEYDVYFKGHLVDVWIMYDWSTTRDDYLYDSNRGISYWIEDNKVFEERKYDNRPSEFYVMSRDGNWKEVSMDRDGNWLGLPEDGHEQTEPNISKIHIYL